MQEHPNGGEQDTDFHLNPPFIDVPQRSKTAGRDCRDLAFMASRALARLDAKRQHGGLASSHYFQNTAFVFGYTVTCSKNLHIRQMALTPPHAKEAKHGPALLSRL